jgi:hypothetical protein
LFLLMVYLYMTIIPLSRRDNKDASGFQHLGTKCPEVVKAGERQNRSPAGLTLHNSRQFFQKFGQWPPQLFIVPLQGFNFLGIDPAVGIGLDCHLIEIV